MIKKWVYATIQSIVHNCRMERNRQKLGKNFRKMKNFPAFEYCYFCTATCQRSFFFITFLCSRCHWKIFNQKYRLLVEGLAYPCSHLYHRELTAQLLKFLLNLEILIYKLFTRTQMTHPFFERAWSLVWKLAFNIY